MTLSHTCTPNTNIYLIISTCTRMMKDSVSCLVNVLFCVTYWNISNIYCTNCKETHKSCACFQHANTRSSRMFGRVCMLKASAGLVCLFAICTIAICIFQYVTQNSTFTRQNTLSFIILVLKTMFTWYREYMYVIRSFKWPAFTKPG